MAPAWWRRYLDWRLRHTRRLVLDDEGFSVLARAGGQTMRWDAIRSVTAFKRDLLTVDLLCLAVASMTEIVEIDEDMTGYAEVELQLNTRLGFGDDWRLAVLFPAYASNPTILFIAT